MSQFNSSIIVVGGGLAGLAATIEAARNGAFITLIDKEKNIGGNSAKATSGINGVNTSFQNALHIEDSNALFEKDTLESGGYTNDPGLVKALSAHSGEAVEWLAEFELDLSILTQCGGHSLKRTHREPDKNGRPSPVGWDIVAALKKHVESVLVAQGKVKIMTETKLTGLIQKDHQVTGAIVEIKGAGKSEMIADAVILTTGGYASDWTSTSLIREFAPHLEGIATTNGPWATGDGFKIGRSIGAAYVDMDKIQIHPTGFVSPADVMNPVKFLAPEALRGEGGILVNSFGKRFSNELGPRDYVTERIFKECQKYPESNLTVAYLILNQDAARAFSIPSLEFYGKKGLINKIENLQELSNWIGCPIEDLKKTIHDYNRAADHEIQDPFNKKAFPVKFSEFDSFYVSVITPSIHYSMGGLKINPSCEVLYNTNTENVEFRLAHYKPILGLYAAGEASGGVHGKNRLAGNSLLECVVFGRIAGQRAAHINDDIIGPGLSKEDFKPLRFRQILDAGEDTKVFRFDLPSSRQKTGLSVGEYISIRAKVNGESIVRCYSPLSRPDDLGLLDLLVKADAKGGLMSNFLSSLKHGDIMEFKGPMGGIQLDISKPGHIKNIGMICGGTGISPMIQIIRSVIHHSRDDLHLRLMYGALNEKELVFKDLLERKSKELPDFKLFFTLDQPPPNWPYAKGFITKEAIQGFMFPPSSDTKIVLCGPPGMCKAIKNHMKELGYTDENFYSFM